MSFLRNMSQFSIYSCTLTLTSGYFIAIWVVVEHPCNTLFSESLLSSSVVVVRGQDCTYIAYDFGERLYIMTSGTGFEVDTPQNMHII